MISQLYVVGGEQREPRGVSAGMGDWYRFKRALILSVDADADTVAVAAQHVSPPGSCPEVEPAILFKSSSVRGDRLYACTQTEVLVYQLPGFELIHYLSLPFFNDLHHVLPTDVGTLLVAISGLDMVVEIQMDGTVVKEWNAVDPGADPWARFSRATDYRLIATTKPHLAHPNHVFRLQGEPWATRFEQRDAVSLVDGNGRIAISIERPHDGVVHGDAIYFTTVDGHIVIVDAKDLRIREVIDLTAMHPREVLLGWCRGILVDGDRAWVGFSRIRPTRFRENVGWALRGFRKDYGTHISCYDLKAKRCLQQINLEDHALGAVFSILPGSSR